MAGKNDIVFVVTLYYFFPQEVGVFTFPPDIGINFTLFVGEIIPLVDLSALLIIAISVGIHGVAEYIHRLSKR